MTSMVKANWSSRGNSRAMNEASGWGRSAISATNGTRSARRPSRRGSRRAGLLPGLEAGGLRLHDLAHQVLGHADRSIAHALRLAHRRALDLVEGAVRAGEPRDGVAEALVDHQLVRQRGERGHLAGALA